MSTSSGNNDADPIQSKRFEQQTDDLAMKKDESNQNVGLKLPPLSLVPEWIDEFTTDSPSVVDDATNTAVEDPDPNKTYEEDSQTEEDSTSPSHQQTNWKTTTCSVTPSLENCLSYDEISQILRYLSLKDILSFSNLSKQCRKISMENDSLWKVKFDQRWNCNVEVAGLPEPVYQVYDDILDEEDDYCSNDNTSKSDGVVSGSSTSQKKKKTLAQKEEESKSFWRQCYQNAYSNPHDLWITHWNCVMPMDGTSPGRTVVPDLTFIPRPETRPKPINHHNDEDNELFASGYKSHLQQKCPTCRHHPLLQKPQLNGQLEELKCALDTEIKFQMKKKTVVNFDDDDDPVDNAQKIMAAHSLLLSDTESGAGTAPVKKLFSKQIGTSPARTIYHSSQYSLSKWSRHMSSVHNLDIGQNPSEIDIIGVTSDDDDNHDSDLVTKSMTRTGKKRNGTNKPATKFMKKRRQTSIEAFEKSSTFNRQIKCDQFRSSGLNFMKDTLFFPIQPSHQLFEGISKKEKPNNTNNKTNENDINKNNLSNTSSPSSEIETPEGDQNRTFSDSGPYTEKENAMLDTFGQPQYQEVAGSDQAPSEIFAHEPPLLANEPGTLSSLSHRYDTAQHSWHIIRLTNPDYVRPITFRVYIQRMDCFTAYPSEGILKPGETCFVTLGVRTLGSLVADSFDEIDTKREEASPAMMHIFRAEGYLPYNGFAIRYMYCPPVPCIPADCSAKVDFDDDANNAETEIPFPINADTREELNKETSLVDTLWNNIRSEDEVREIYLSSHVNSKVTFDEFQNLTLSPFEDPTERSSDGYITGSVPSSKAFNPMIFVCPDLQQKHSSVYSALQQIQSSVGTSDSEYCTEQHCSYCGKNWGARSEILARSFLLRKAVCENYSRQRSRRMYRLVECLRAIPRLCDQVSQRSHHQLKRRKSSRQKAAKTESINTKLLQRIFHLLNSIHVLLLNQRGKRYLTRNQIQLLQSYEIYENGVYLQLSKFSRKENLNILEEESGVYKYSRSTGSDVSVDALITKLKDEGIDESLLVVKDEPAFLRQFKSYCFSPGLYELGEYEENCDQPSGVFKDDYYLGACGGLSMIHDPRSVIGYGLYDRMTWPGSVVRCHFTQSECFNPLTKKQLDVLRENAVGTIRLWESTADVKSDWHLSETQVDDWIKLENVLFSINDPDESVHKSMIFVRKPTTFQTIHINFARSFVNDIPPPGVGRFALAAVRPPVVAENQTPPTTAPEIIELDIRGMSHSSQRSTESTPQSNHVHDQAGNNNLQQEQQRVDRQRIQDPPFLLFGNARPFSFLWSICAQLGFSVEDEGNPGDIMVDRRLMIGVQWLSNSLMILPLLWTLVARAAMWISPYPSHEIFGMPHYSHAKKMRFLSSSESGFAAFLLFMLWLVLGRHAEKNMCRTYTCRMSDQSNATTTKLTMSSLKATKLSTYVIIWQKFVDYCCPLFLQRLLPANRWNEKSLEQVQSRIIQARGNDRREYRPYYCAKERVYKGDRVLNHEDECEPTIRWIICIIVGGGSFITSSPHYILNLCIVFLCSISLGLSMSLNYMEINRISKFRTMHLQVVVTTVFLIGQLVGSSGGILFLAEFVVTSVGLLVGGAATISTNALESWICFFCLSSTAFWGYLLARVSLANGIREKRPGSASLLLMISFFLFAILWIMAAFFFEWDLPTTTMIVHSSWRPLAPITAGTPDQKKGDYSSILA